MIKIQRYWHTTLTLLPLRKTLDISLLFFYEANACLQGKLAELYIYKEQCEKVDEQFQSVYAEAVSVANNFRAEEKSWHLCGYEIDMDNIPLEAI